MRSSKSFFYYCLLFLIPLSFFFLIGTIFLTINAYNYPHRGALASEHKSWRHQIEGDEQIGFVPAKNNHSVWEGSVYFTDRLGARVNSKGDQTPSRPDPAKLRPSEPQNRSPFPKEPQAAVPAHHRQCRTYGPGSHLAALEVG